ncbi:lytic transglycosylase domain-containing protein [Anaerovorax sp. IOR16]|uniref:lytic transglycosylase domain-containing protein n=1 Tax=Anaerovorax sp. IOR16 TaxID=2773458 RepID=UPI0019D13437|nr:lytic transglycosylase domain-containing protein [Anaerovorax sp. IOR16]
MSQIINFSYISNMHEIKLKERDKKIVHSDFLDVLNKEMHSSQMKEKNIELESIFERAAKKYQVPLNLLKAVAKAESNFNINAVSHCGAQGVMQLMPKTAAALGVEDAFDPEQNIFGGANYLSQKLKQYGGNIKLALAAYNAGSGNVKKYRGIPPFEETHNYINKVIEYMEGGLSVDNVNQNKNLQSMMPFEQNIEIDKLLMISYEEILKATLRMNILSHSLGNLTETGDFNNGA